MERILRSLNFASWIAVTIYRLLVSHATCRRRPTVSWNLPTAVLWGGLLRCLVTYCDILWLCGLGSSETRSLPLGAPDGVPRHGKSKSSIHRWWVQHTIFKKVDMLHCCNAPTHLQGHINSTQKPSRINTMWCLVWVWKTMSNFWTAGVVPVCHHRPGQSESCVASRRDPGYTLVAFPAPSQYRSSMSSMSFFFFFFFIIGISCQCWNRFELRLHISGCPCQQRPKATITNALWHSHCLHGIQQ